MPVLRKRGTESGTRFVCPKKKGGCGHPETKIVNSRVIDDDQGTDVKFRTRVCPKCGARFVTEERVYAIRVNPNRKKK